MKLEKLEEVANLYQKHTLLDEAIQKLLPFTNKKEIGFVSGKLEVITAKCCDTIKLDEESLRYIIEALTRYKSSVESLINEL